MLVAYVLAVYMLLANALAAYTLFIKPLVAYESVTLHRLLELRSEVEIIVAPPCGVSVLVDKRETRGGYWSVVGW